MDKTGACSGKNRGRVRERARKYERKMRGKEDAYKDGASNKGWDDCDVNVNGKERRDEIR